MSVNSRRAAHVAGTAASAPIAVAVGVGFVVLVTLGAMRLADVLVARSTFPRPVFVVAIHGAQPKMLRPDARRVIAGVADQERRGDDGSGQAQGETMGKARLAVQLEAAVSVTIAHPCPHPAITPHTNVLKEPIGNVSFGINAHARSIAYAKHKWQS